MSTVHCQQYKCLYNTEAECQKEHILIEETGDTTSPRCISWVINSAEDKEAE